MKKLSIIFLLLYCSCIVLSACSQGTINDIESNSNNISTTNNATEEEQPRKDKEYAVFDLYTLNEWVKRKDKDVLPNTPDQPITKEAESEYGDLSYLIDKISSNGYFNIVSEYSSVLIQKCSLYDVENIHDMFFLFEVTVENDILSLPCYITYIPEEYLTLANTSPVDCILEVRDISLYNIDSPLIIDGKKIVREVKQITVGGKEYTSIVQEYVDSKYTNKSGAIFIVVENMIVQIQRPLSNPKISQALENIKFEVIYVSE